MEKVVAVQKKEDGRKRGRGEKRSGEGSIERKAVEKRGRTKWRGRSENQ